MGTADVRSIVLAALPAGRVVAVSQRGWVVVARILSDSDGQVRLDQLETLARALDVDPVCISVRDSGTRGVVEVHLDLDHQAPGRLAAGSGAWPRLS